MDRPPSTPQHGVKGLLCRFFAAGNTDDNLDSAIIAQRVAHLLHLLLDHPPGVPG